MTSKRLPKQITFWMDINDYNDIQDFFIEDERTMSTFLRVAIRKELNIGDIESKNNQIMVECQNESYKRPIKFLIGVSDFVALKRYLKNGGVSLSAFCRYLVKKELRRF